MTNKIKMLMIEAGLTQSELAEKLGITQPTLSGKFKLDNWKESDLREIARICGATYEGTFTTSDGKTI